MLQYLFPLFFLFASCESNNIRLEGKFEILHPQYERVLFYAQNGQREYVYHLDQIILEYRDGELWLTNVTREDSPQLIRFGGDLSPLVTGSKLDIDHQNARQNFSITIKKTLTLKEKFQQEKYTECFLNHEERRVASTTTSGDIQFEQRQRPVTGTQLVLMTKESFEEQYSMHLKRPEEGEPFAQIYSRPFKLIKEKTVKVLAPCRR